MAMELTEVIGSWLFNRPKQGGFRNNIQAGELDKKNPKHAMRYLYNLGMGKNPGDLKDAMDFFSKFSFKSLISGDNNFEPYERYEIDSGVNIGRRV